MSFDEDGNDSYELDPFGEGDYDPSLAFALVAARQADIKVRDALAFIQGHVPPNAALTNQIAASARHRSGLLLDRMHASLDEVQRAALSARDAAAGSSTETTAIAATVGGFHAISEMYEDLTGMAAAMAHPDLIIPVHQGVVPPLDTPDVASQKIYNELTQWLTPRRGQGNGELAVVIATPGTGKTHQMLRLALAEQLLRQRVTYTVRTKKMIVSAPGDPPAELIQRAYNVSITGRVSLVTIVGRDDTNCYKYETVKAVQAHGYAPGPAVCSKCEYYPDNARQIGLGVCPYYQGRLNAHLLSQGARRGLSRLFPLVFTNHSSYVMANRSSGGRWGAFWGSDLVVCDEDPTDAMEVDVVLTEEQCQFTSRGPNTLHAGMAAELFRNAIAAAREERKKASTNRFRASGSDVPNSHQIHTEYDSAYVGLELHKLLRFAYAKLLRSYNLPSLAGVLRDVTHGASFHVDPGELVDIKSVDDINAMDVPPRSLATVADMAYAEIEHSWSLRSIVYEHLKGRPPPPDAVDMLERETCIDPMSYVTRLECLPRDPAKGRLEDQWRFVVRDFRPWANHSANVIVGDAYAQRALYEQLFGRPAHVIETVATLHEDAVITRVLRDDCSIGKLREGGLQDILLLVEVDIAARVQPGERVLIYAHRELQAGKLNAWMADVSQRYGITMAFEYWWGGRGKDEYNGWEHTYTLSDPVQSLSGIRHVANARAFRDSVNAKTVDEKLLHGREQRIDQGSLGRGVVRALRASDQRIALEHDRMNVAELTQALHRSRPVHHPTRITVYGSMEQSADLLAQTVTVVPDEYRKERWAASHRKSSAKTRQVSGAVDAFVTSEEAWRAVRGIVDWFGVYSPWFAHALVTASIEIRLPPPIPLNVFKVAPESSESLQNPVPGDGDGGSCEDLGVDVGATEPAALPNRRTPIRRVWDPPVYWALLKAPAALPNAIRELHKTLAQRPGLRSVPTARWPSWCKGESGRRPTVFYDPALVARPDTALQLYYEIVETQYGRVVDGRLYRPHFVERLPPCLKTLPF